MEIDTYKDAAFIVGFGAILDILIKKWQPQLWEFARVIAWEKVSGIEITKIPRSVSNSLNNVLSQALGTDGKKTVVVGLLSIFWSLLWSIRLLDRDVIDSDLVSFTRDALVVLTPILFILVMLIFMSNKLNLPEKTSRFFDNRIERLDRYVASLSKVRQRMIIWSLYATCIPISAVGFGVSLSILGYLFYCLLLTLIGLVLSFSSLITAAEFKPMIDFIDWLSLSLPIINANIDFVSVSVSFIASMDIGSAGATLYMIRKLARTDSILLGITLPIIDFIVSIIFWTYAQYVLKSLLQLYVETEEMKAIELYVSISSISVLLVTIVLDVLIFALFSFKLIQLLIHISLCY